MVRMVDLIEKKQEHETLTTEEIKWMIEGYTIGEIPDYQMSAMLMAIYFQGMAKEELRDLTVAMVKSGDEIDLSAIKGVKVDKHSTGGVGDTTTLVLAPLVASVGVPVPKMSGRGLGHTGGTLDKLESIEGFHIEITQDEFVDLVNKNKLALVGQSGNLTPADKKIYALRDVTSTVGSIPLIASSIMSKKIASGADAIVLDVKVGTGAFMKNIKEAKELAETMVEIGNSVGRDTMAVISDMSQPLGEAIGNAMEVKEAINTLKGEGPEDLTELCLVLGSQMAYLGGVGDNLDDARAKLEANIKNGKALEQFKLFIEAQGGNPKVADHPDELLPRASYQVEVTADRDGIISEVDAEELGVAAMILGAGRETINSKLDLAAGLMLHKKIGDEVKKGDSLLTIHSNKKDVDASVKIIKNNIKISDHAEPVTLIHEVIH
ncbi:pyrimidine-nucleoside phosphorylase [Atopostipes suicloacalis DSM 15692]|uniref:Pyrimidine-nucleoside phosphorylase n=1 Tax=Atopostipes suicloacalis DSM 15692 TaxID=1121025 RepID=A0A1M4WV63_9LACT|nr:pyrimidine-nucleoside phosphorylase [Atopostipes suicloacalis]SHE85116.1 pyrimidine-nucleoside phosphorylase [Atopostipes suicloacalis DSM 15692]